MRDLVVPPGQDRTLAKEKSAQRSDSVSLQTRVMGKKASMGTSDFLPDPMQSLPTTYGPQLLLYPWMRDLDGNKEC